jgi:dienelactone hydrolase
MGARTAFKMVGFAVRACLCVSFFAIVAGLSCLASASGDPAPASAFFGGQTTEVFRLSPSGKLVAFLQNDGRSSRLCVGRPGNLGSSTSVLTSTEQGNVFTFLWLSDSRIAYSARVSGEGDVTGFISLGDQNDERLPSTVTQLTQPDEHASLSGTCFGSHGTLGLVLSMPSSHGEEWSDLCWAAIGDGGKELLYRNTDQLAVCNVSRDGKTVAGVRCNKNGEKELIVVRGGVSKSLLRTTPSDSLNIAAISKDGEFVYVLSNTGHDADLVRLEKIGSSSGTGQLLAEDPERVVDLEEVLFDRNTETPVGVRYYRHLGVYHWFDSLMADRYRDLRGRLPEGELKIVEVSSDMSYLLVSSITDSETETEYYYDALQGRLSRLTSKKTTVPKSRLGKMTTVSYHARDGEQISGYLTLPTWTPQKMLPTVVFPHGGPNKRNYWGYDPRVQFLANRGYAVFQPNFRGSSGFGKRFQNAGDKQWGRGVMQDDITDGVQWLVSSCISDPAKIAILGGSYGGFAALAGVTFTPELYAAGISLFGPSDLTEFVTHLPESWQAVEGDIKVKIGDPKNESDRERMSAQSPVHFVDQIRVPLLIYQGALDGVVKRQQADAFVGKCRSLGKTVDYLVSNDEGHGFNDSANERAVYAAIERFFEPILGGLMNSEPESLVSSRIDSLRKSGTPLR